MVPAKRPNHDNPVTRSALGYLPEWMKIKDPDSRGSRFIGAIYGQELDLLKRTALLYSKYTNIKDAPIETISKMYEVELDYPFASGYIKPTDASGNALSFKIKVVEDQTDFFSNPPTRLQYIDKLKPSGINKRPLSGVIAGIEYLSGYPSGIFVIQRQANPIDPSSTLYYTIDSGLNAINPIPFSGDALALDHIGLKKNSSYDLLQPEPNWSIQNKYPTKTWISPSGEINVRPTGITLLYNSFIDVHTGEKIYNRKMLNNPYGSGVYTLADVDLTFYPVSGSTKVYDIQNLDPSGNPTEIIASGTRLYYFASGLTTGIWEYKGYVSPIPKYLTPPEIIHNIEEKSGSGYFTPITPSSLMVTSWRFLPSGGYIDDEVFPHSGTFRYIDGTGRFGKKIRFTNAISKYQAEYKYSLHDSITQLSAEPRDSVNSTASKTGSLYFIDGSSRWKEVPTEKSRTDVNAVRIDPKLVRPNTSVQVNIEVDSKLTDTWINAKTTSKTLHFYRNNIGAFNDFGKL